ncbi:conserved hypothetical protein [Desulfamplus magnetovallimortis]|uniref:AAA+ ATPase domain-containing protein n=1 Tax=Desulfamplus magnetovallimortis TaxID=1246637 RepID=A0A1W1HD31_9BACT|nr:ATP-binding protein [Desulfamplus magnetovallimortis]SLM30302.1 conserved hypothetical protein [Desulfamplus magnetovallimortis]
MMMKRCKEGYLEQWLQKKRQKPLILRGARQTGKSTLVRMFASNQGLKLNEINLERHLYLNDIFKTLDMDIILRELEGVIGANPEQNDAILFLDEIQATPHALQALRYFYEEKPLIPVIAAGSLLEFTLSDHTFSMPVGRVEYLHIFPMTFKEFLMAISPDLLQYIEGIQMDQSFDAFATSLPESVHNRLVKKQREYFFTGGMPEAILAYSDTGSALDVTDVHRSILDTYLDDFAKYGKQIELPLMQRVFRFIPRMLGKKVKYSNIDPQRRAREIRNVIDLLSNARICHKVYHTHANGVPLLAEINESIYKLIFMDIGIANHICGNDWRTLHSFMEHELVNEGGLAEQFIGQHLLILKHDAPVLCYWLREKKSANAEVDYVISHGNSVFPVEVKSGKSGTLKSLQQFVLNKNTPLAVRFDLNPPSIQEISHITAGADGNQRVDFTLLSLPLYMVEELPRLIDLKRQK